MVQLALAFFVQEIDLSFTGPYRILYILKDYALLVGGILFPFTAFDRFIATRNPEHYEQKTKPIIAITLVVLAVIVGLTIQILIAFGIFHLIALPIFLFAINLCSAIMMYFIVKRNHQNMESYYEFVLGHRLQLRENLRTCAAIYPNLILSSFASLCGAVFYIAAVYQTNQYLSMLTFSMFNAGVALYLVLSPAIMMIAVEKFRKKLINLFRPPKTQCNVQSNTQVYFRQLEAQWGR
uniref:Gustatory receptor n=1 Tax=Panagrolaimus sp. JU765 TaxID=591449 RepID=A0AC34RIL1_9BILA